MRTSMDLLLMQGAFREGMDMANICDQRLFIVAVDDESAKELLSSMSENFKAATNVDLLKGIGSEANWKIQAEAIERGTYDYNLLCLLDTDPDVGSEGCSFSAETQYGKPCVRIDLGLKWGPYPLEYFCDQLDPERYGCASINGGEYICALCEADEEVAYIQWGKDFGDSSDGGLWYDEFQEWSKKVKGSSPESLSDIALRVLFDTTKTCDFFWESSKAGTFKEIERIDPGLLDEIAEALDCEDAEDLRYSVCDVDDLENMVRWKVADEGLRKRLDTALKECQ